MRFVKLAIISAIVLFIVIFLFSLIIPSTVRVSRAIDISASKDSLVAQLADLRQWKQWNKMVDTPQFNNEQFTETTINGEHMTISKKSLMGDTLLTEWKQPNARVLNSGFSWYGDDGRLVLQWYFDIKLRWYPWEKFGSIVFDKQLGPPMEKSLGNLKKLLEKNP